MIHSLYESRSNIIVLPKGKLAVVQGLEDYIVAESDNVLLICKKEEEQRIRVFVADAKLKMGGGLYLIFPGPKLQMGRFLKVSAPFVFLMTERVPALCFKFDFSSISGNKARAK